MENDLEKELESLIHQELSRLENLQAPATLIPQVMKAIAARSQREWWRQPWTNWPKSLQIASLPVLLIHAAAIIFTISLAWKLYVAKVTVSEFQQGFHFATSVWEVLSTLLNAIVIVVQGASQQWLLVSLGVGAMMYLTCIGLGTLLVRVALHKR